MVPFCAGSIVILLVFVALTPFEVEFTTCGRAVEIPVAASAFPGGHNPRVGFFLVAQFESAEETLVLLVCVEDADIVDVFDAVDAIDDEEFFRCNVARGLRSLAKVELSISILSIREWSFAVLHLMLLC